MADISTEDLAQAAADLVVSRLAEKYTLVYVDRGECLSDEQIHKLLAGEEDVLNDDWFFENRAQGTNHVLSELLDDDVRQFLEENDVLEQVREAVEERDESDPLGDLMRMTSSKLFRYQLDAEAKGEPWRLSEDEADDAARRLGEDIGVSFEDNADPLRELVAHASYGGNAHILWHGDVRTVYDAVRRVRFHEPAPEITIQWTDPELLVLDSWNGSGHSVKVRGTIRLAFNPNHLFLDTAKGPGGYSWTDVVGAGYQSEGDEPEFSTSKEENA
ncbi:hypothetical protein [Streptomyces sp. NPDC017260]|uniref:hypothetical protein n=1 Tax=unclassified Streptomyces TaxID=2593676 RepID=UPI0037A3DCEC